MSEKPIDSAEAEFLKVRPEHFSYMRAARDVAAHIAKYPVATLDQRTKEILIGRVAEDVEKHQALHSELRIKLGEEDEASTAVGAELVRALMLARELAEIELSEDLG